jgi:hypothetical protein
MNTHNSLESRLLFHRYAVYIYIIYSYWFDVRGGVANMYRIGCDRGRVRRDEWCPSCVPNPCDSRQASASDTLSADSFHNVRFFNPSRNSRFQYNLCASPCAQVLSSGGMFSVPVMCPSVLVSAEQENAGEVWCPLSCKSQSRLSETPHKSAPRCGPRARQ